MQNWQNVTVILWYRVKGGDKKLENHVPKAS